MSDALGGRFCWAGMLLDCARQMMSDAVLERSVLFQGRGTDSDFSGGAAGWETACHFINAAANVRGWQVDLAPRTVCDPCLNFCAVNERMFC